MARVLSSEQSTKLVDIIIDYLVVGAPISVIKVRMQYECERFKTNGKSLYKSMAINQLEERSIHAILSSLKIKPKSNPSQLDGYYEILLKNSKSLHELLTKLSHDGHQQIRYLLGLINHTKPATNWTIPLLLAAVSSAGLGIFFYLKKQYLDTVIDWFSKTFPSVVKWLAMLRNLPLLGLMNTGLGLIWTWYNTLANGSGYAAKPKRLSSLAFKTLTAALAMCAYYLCFLASGAMTIPAASLFFLSACIVLVKNSINLYKNAKILRNMPDPNGQGEWEELAEYERAKNYHQRSRASLIIKLLAAIFTTIAVTLWNCFPPSMIITISCMAFILLTNLTKRTLVSAINEKYANKLQEDISHIKAPLKIELNASYKTSLTRLNQRNLTLSEPETTLSARETVIAQREQTVEETLEALRQGQSPNTALLRLRSEIHSIATQTDQHDGADFLP